MRKRVLNPEASNDSAWAQATGTTPAFSSAVVIETPEYDRVFLAGATASEPDLSMGEQTRDILEQFASWLAKADGDMTDIVRVRVYVEEPHLTQDNLEQIHRTRGEFFDPAHYPASTLVEISRLIRDGRHIEIDAEAIIPRTDWDNTVE